MNKKARGLVWFGVLLALTLALPLGCVPPPPAPPVAPSFTFTPPEQANKLLPITIALVHPAYADPARTAWNHPWARATGSAFASALHTDLQKSLIAKGFKVTGPYQDLNTMTFPEKKGAHLTLTPIVDIRAEPQVTHQVPPARFLLGKEEGILVVGGKIALVLLEPLSSERMWHKVVDVAAVQAPYVVTYAVTMRDGQQSTRIHQDTRPQALTTALNTIYPAVLQQAWTYFHPEEVLMIMKESEEARARKRY